jgi:hypothetical protein
METSAETANYRKSRLMLWQAIIASHQDYVDDGMKSVQEAQSKGASSPTEADVRAGAAQHVRGEVRALCTDLLTRTPIPAIVGFLERAPDWSDATERLIDDPPQNAALVELIQSAYPHRTWAKKMDALQRQVAADAASWSAWVKGWGEEYGAAAKTILKGTGDALGGLGSALGGLGQGVGTLLRWAPYIAAGAAAVGVVTLAVVTTRK